MRFKDFPIAELKVDEERFQFEGYASRFWNVDLQGDVVARGAFTKTVQERLPKRLIKVLWQHRERRWVSRWRSRRTTRGSTSSRR